MFLGSSRSVVFEILSQLSGACLVIDCTDKTEQLNPSLCALLNIKEDLATFSDIGNVTTHEEFSKLQNKVAALTNEQETFKHFLLRTYDKVLDCSGEIVVVAKHTFVLLQFEDVTETEQQQVMLHQKEQVFDKTPFPMWVRDGTFEITESNAAFEHISVNHHNSKLAQKSHKEHVAQSENRPIVVQGERRLFKITEVPTETGTVGFAIDITKRKEVEKRLNFSVSVQRQFLEASASAVSIYDADKKLMFYNQVFSNLWKLDTHWLDKHPTYGQVLEKLREKRALPEQTDFQEFKESQLRMFSNLAETYEELLYCPDGKTIRHMIMPHTSGGLICTFDDVSDKMALEASYNTLMAVQRETLDNLKEGIAFFGENGLLKLYNPTFATMIGLDTEYLDTCPHFINLIQKIKAFGGDWEYYKEHLTRVFSSREAINEIIEWQNHKTLDLNTIPLPDGGLLCSFADITDSMLVERTLREKNKALEQADKLKTNFLENISYELRSPLTSIMGFSEALKHNYFGELNPKQKEYMEHIFSASQNLKDLIDTVLFLTSIEAGCVKLNIENIPISTMLNDVVSERKKELLEKELSVEIQCTQGLDILVGDQEHLQQALLQILTNAIAFSPKGDTIIIGAERHVMQEEGELSENDIILWIKDNGVGVEKEEQRSLFDYNKIDVAKAGISGVGIGLALAKRILTLHGGDLRIESEKGGGTKVMFFIPQSVKLSEDTKQIAFILE